MTYEQILDKIKDIPSNVQSEDTLMHVKYLQPLEGHPLLLDFGTGWGKLVISMALACPQAEIYTFDPGTPYQEYEPKVKQILQDHLGDTLHFQINNSYDHEWSRPLDVLSIDSSHTYEDTKHEINKYFPYLKHGGLLLLHDYNVPTVGVKQAVDEYFAINPHQQVEFLDEGGFTTVIQKQ